MIRSTLGFIFTPDLHHVLLITKQKPEFHKGKLNGLGGKSEGNECDLECIVREVEEESGLVIPAEKWQQIGQMKWTEWNVAIFATVHAGKMQDVRQLSKEDVQWYKVDSLPGNVLSNLPWLIPLCIDCLKNELPPRVQVVY